MLDFWGVVINGLVYPLNELRISTYPKCEPILQASGALLKFPDAWTILEPMGDDGSAHFLAEETHGDSMGVGVKKQMSHKKNLPTPSLPNTSWGSVFDRYVFGVQIPSSHGVWKPRVLSIVV